ncbi:MAG: dihydrolipoyl dehydrogenase, partial [Desulfobacteraceae bacterium]|nr:dihydrolipoyl dehydrogenase [Desulfobacteraceae bacterium]
MAIKTIVIGGGPGGYVAAIRAASLGSEVTLIEKEDLGGTCLNWGCIPSKIMKHSADLYQKLTKAKDFGIQCTGDILPDMAALMMRKEKILKTQRKGIESLLTSNTIAIEKGRAQIKAKGMVKVVYENEPAKALVYDRLIIATGTKPLNVPDFAFDGKRILSSDHILTLDHVPESLVIVGGGVIGCEFAFIFSALGSQVTVIEAMSRLLPLPSVDEACSKLLLREMKKKKIKVLCDTIVTSASQNNGELNINLDVSPFTDNPKPKKLKINQIKASKMAVCIGRTPLSSDLGLESIGLETNKQGWIDANEKMETSVENVYAIGDILGPEKVMLAHVASHEGMVAAENALGRDSIMNYDVIPGAIFTMPEIGTVGLSETQAKEKGIDVEAFSVNFRVLGKAQAIDEIAGQAKMIVEKQSRKILGVHIIGAHATDLVAEATLAIEKGLTANEVAHTIHAH